MTTPHELSGILAALEANAREIETFFLALPQESFFAGEDAAWGPAHHLSHLTLAHKRVGRGFAAPDMLPPNEGGASRTLEQIRAAYDARLAQVPREQLRQNPLPPRLVPGATQAEVVRDYVEASARTREAAGRWSDADCDARAMQHPFLGWMSAREMLLFFVLHDRLHLDGVRRRFAGGS